MARIAEGFDDADAARGASGYDYDAFLSYSHAADGRLAPAVQRLLHRIAKPRLRLRALRVFRDQSSLSANPDLWASVRSALERSRYFVLLASPSAASSPWVCREVEYWQEHREPDTLLIALTEGELAWDRSAGDVDWQVSNALPPCLEGWFVGEPLWVDLRWARDDEQLSERHHRFRDVVASLAAPMHGLPKDELDSEDVRQFRRARGLRRAAVTALVALLLAAAVAGLVAFDQRGTAVEQRDRAEREATVANSRSLAAEADALATRDPALSARLAVAAFRLAPTPQATGGMMRSLERNRHVAGFIEESSEHARSPGAEAPAGRAGAVAFSGDGTLLAIGNRQDGEVRIHDLRKGELRHVLTSAQGGMGEPAVQPVFTPDDAQVIVIQSVTVDAWDTRSGRLAWRRAFRPGVSPLQVSADGRVVLVGDDDGLSYFDTSRPHGALRSLSTSDGFPVDYRVVVGDAGVPRLVRSPQSRGTFTPFAVAASAARAASVHRYETVELRDLSGATLARQRLPRSDGRWAAVEISADGGVIVVGDDQGRVAVIDGGQARELGELPVAISDLAVTSDGARVAAVDTDGNVQLFDAVSDRRFGELPGTAGRIGPDGAAEPQTLTVDARGRWLLVDRDTSVEAWDLAGRRFLGAVPAETFDQQHERLGVPATTPRSAFGADGDSFAVRGAGRISVRNLPALRTIAAEQLGDDPVADARVFAQRLGRVFPVLWSDGSEESNLTFVQPQETDRTVRTSGQVLIDAASNHAIVVEDVDATGIAQRATVYSMRGDRVRRIGSTDLRSYAVFAAASRDGRYLAIGCAPDTEIIDIASPDRRRWLSGGSGAGSSSEFAFAARGTLVVQYVEPDRTSVDGGYNRLLLWDRASGVLIGEWPDPMRVPNIFSNETDLVVAGDDTALTIRPDGAIALWSIDPDAWAAQLCQLSGPLQPDERDRYLASVDLGAVCPRS